MEAERRRLAEPVGDRRAARVQDDGSFACVVEHTSLAPPDRLW
jgi:hypothetical protein